MGITLSRYWDDAVSRYRDEQEFRASHWRVISIGDTLSRVYLHRYNKLIIEELQRDTSVCEVTIEAATHLVAEHTTSEYHFLTYLSTGVALRQVVFNYCNDDYYYDDDSPPIPPMDSRQLSRFLFAAWSNPNIKTVYLTLDPCDTPEGLLDAMRTPMPVKKKLCVSLPGYFPHEAEELANALAECNSLDMQGDARDVVRMLDRVDANAITEELFVYFTDDTIDRPVRHACPACPLALKRVLSNTTTLQTLGISCCTFTDDEPDNALWPVLETNATVQELQIRNCIFQPVNLNRFKHCMLHGNVRKLVASYAPFDDDTNAILCIKIFAAASLLTEASLTEAACHPNRNGSLSRILRVLASKSKICGRNLALESTVSNSRALQQWCNGLPDICILRSLSLDFGLASMDHLLDQETWRRRLLKALKANGSLTSFRPMVPGYERQMQAVLERNEQLPKLLGLVETSNQDLEEQHPEPSHDPIVPLLRPALLRAAEQSPQTAVSNTLLGLLAISQDIDGTGIDSSNGGNDARNVRVANIGGDSNGSECIADGAAGGTRLDDDDVEMIEQEDISALRTLAKNEMNHWNEGATQIREQKRILSEQQDEFQACATRAKAKFDRLDTMCRALPAAVAGPSQPLPEAPGPAAAVPAVALPVAVAPAAASAVDPAAAQAPEVAVPLPAAPDPAPAGVESCWPVQSGTRPLGLS